MGPCPAPRLTPVTLAEAMPARRSAREFGPAPVKEILALVGWVTAVRATRVSDRLRRTRRLAPAAGALHPVDLVVVAGGRRGPLLLRVDPWSGAVTVLAERAPGGAAGFLGRLPHLLPMARGTALVLLADRARLSAAYHRPESLLWRDAGALLATIHLAAEAMGLAACLTGLLGEEVAASLFLGSGRVIAAGTCVIGRPA